MTDLVIYECKRIALHIGKGALFGGIITAIVLLFMNW